MFPSYFPEGKPLTETQFLAFPESPDRVDLIDGGLFISLPPGGLHQHACAALQQALAAGGAEVRRRVDVRLAPDRITCCDLVVLGGGPATGRVVDAARVPLVAEILTPASLVVDTVLKKHLYAAAGIGWYLTVDPAEPAVRLYRLVRGEHVLQTTARPGYVLELTDPVRATVDPVALVPRR